MSAVDRLVAWAQRRQVTLFLLATATVMVMTCCWGL